MTSGAMPPHTNNGKTFIHDPKISNQAETKGAIKCKFKSHNGKEVSSFAISFRYLLWEFTNF